MAEDRLAALRATAEAATPGYWHVCEDGPDEMDRAVCDLDDQPVAGLRDEWYEPIPGEATTAEDAAHIATFDPPTVLALLDRLEAAERQVKLLSSLVDHLHPAPDLSRPGISAAEVTAPVRSNIARLEAAEAAVERVRALAEDWALALEIDDLVPAARHLVEGALKDLTAALEATP